MNHPARAQPASKPPQAFHALSRPPELLPFFCLPPVNRHIHIAKRVSKTTCKSQTQERLVGKPEDRMSEHRRKGQVITWVVDSLEHVYYPDYLRTVIEPPTGDDVVRHLIPLQSGLEILQPASGFEQYGNILVSHRPRSHKLSGFPVMLAYELLPIGHHLRDSRCHKISLCHRRASELGFAVGNNVKLRPGISRGGHTSKRRGVTSPDIAQGWAKNVISELHQRID